MSRCDEHVYYQRNLHGDINQVDGTDGTLIKADSEGGHVTLNTNYLYVFVSYHHAVFGETPLDLDPTTLVSKNSLDPKDGEMVRLKLHGY